MNELIKITEKDGKRAVNARDLHEFLESKRDFSNWIKDRIEKYELIENQDYVRSTNLSSEGRGGQNKVEYVLSIDAAKELSMVEGNERGKQARRYFIECERMAKEVVQHQIPQTYSDALLLAANQAKQLEEQQKQINRNAPRVLFSHAVETSNKSILIGELSKLINQNGVNIGQNRMFQWLRDNGYLCKKGESYNLPTQKSMDLGLFEIKKTTITKPNGSVLVTTTTKVTGKGQIYLVNLFLNQ